MSSIYNSGNKNIYKTRKVLLSVEKELIKHSSEARASLRNKEIKSTKLIYKINARNVKM